MKLNNYIKLRIEKKSKTYIYSVFINEKIRSILHTYALYGLVKEELFSENNASKYFLNFIFIYDTRQDCLFLVYVTAKTAALLLILPIIKLVIK